MSDGVDSWFSHPAHQHLRCLQSACSASVLVMCKSESTAALVETENAISSDVGIASICVV